MSARDVVSTEMTDAPQDVLATFFAAHRPLPYSTGYPGKPSSWYACTCKDWASNKTISTAEYHHILAFEKHMAEALVADGWQVATPSGESS